MKPVLALDIDGVLNAEDFPSQHQTYIPAAEVPDSPFIRGGGQQDLRSVVRIDPEHGPKLIALMDVVQPVWATTWEASANAHFGPLLGLPELPVGISTLTNPPKFRMDTPGWKAMALEKNFTDQALIWIDDMNIDYVREWERSTTAPTLALVTDERVGMQEWHFKAIATFAEHAGDEPVEFVLHEESEFAIADSLWLMRLAVPTPLPFRDDRLVRVSPRQLPEIITVMESALVANEAPWPSALESLKKDLASISALQ